MYVFNDLISFFWFGHDESFEEQHIIGVDAQMSGSLL
jgi:hypothetical protein